LTFTPLTVSNSYTDTQSLTVTTSTNAASGYVVRQHATSVSSGMFSLPSFNGGTYASPDSWQSGDLGFGYTSSDSSVAGANKFQAATCPGGSALAAPGCYAPLTSGSVGDIVADNAGPVAGTPIINETFTLTYRLASSPTQSAGVYAGVVYFDAVVNF
jgi:hypothetical protein